MKRFLILALAFSALSLTGAEQPPSEDWLTYYYKAPLPDSVSKEVRALADAGLLKNQNAQPPIIAFLSRVMAANPKRIPGWLEEFKDLDKEQYKMLLVAAWYSDTDEAREVFEKQKIEPLLKEKAPNILEMEVNNPTTLDMLWGWFMATGDVAPIRRIVTALSLSKYTGAMDRYKASKQNEKDKVEAYLEVTFRAAMWSLESNCKMHPRVLQHCEEIFADKATPSDQSLWLAVVLSKVKPETYQMETKDRPAGPEGKPAPKTESKAKS